MNGTDPTADRVLVLGGGLAGVACAQKLGDEGIDVVLVDRNDYHQFQPLLYQVASSQLPAEDIARPHRVIFADFPSVTLVTAQVSAVTLSPPSLVLSDGQTLTGSHLVMAAGARPNFFGVPGAAEHAFPLYSVADAERLRLHLQRLLQEAMAGRGSAEPGWAWDYFDRDHAATVEASSVPRRIAWGGDDQDVPHISLDRPESAHIPQGRHEETAVVDDYDMTIVGPGASDETLAHRPVPPGKRVVLRRAPARPPRRGDAWAQRHSTLPIGPGRRARLDLSGSESGRGGCA